MYSSEFEVKFRRGREMEVFRLGELRHLLVTVFLSGLAEYLIRPVMTDVTVAAVCSGLDDSCSLAVYLTGVQQVTVGMGTMVMMPVIGNLSDRYGIKAMLTLPMCLSVLPPGSFVFFLRFHFPSESYYTINNICSYLFTILFGRELIISNIILIQLNNPCKANH